MSRSHRLAAFFTASFLAGASTPSFAGTLTLTPGGTIDISALNIGAVGDITLIDNRIWLSDGGPGGLLYAVNVVGGSLSQTLSPSAVPGFTKGADAMCNVGVASLFVFSSFDESAAGRISTSGALQATYPSAQQATGADFGGGLWIASGTTAGAGSTLMRLDTTTGAVLQTVPIPGLTARIVDLAVDSFAGGMYALCEDDQLREIDTTTGAILSTQNLAPFLIGHNSVEGGMDFEGGGTRLFIANGTGAGADSIVILNREFSTNVCGSLIGSFACPCSNAGTFGRGCRSSTAGSNGALLTSTGKPDVSTDTFAIQAAGLPPGTFVLFFQGTTLNQPSILFGDGALCAGGTNARLAVKPAPSGTASYPEAGDALIHVQGQVPSSVTTRLYQGWYRDSAAFCTTAVFNLTNGIQTEWRP